MLTSGLPSVLAPNLLAETKRVHVTRSKSHRPAKKGWRQDSNPGLFVGLELASGSSKSAALLSESGSRGSVHGEHDLDVLPTALRPARAGVTKQQIAVPASAPHSQPVSERVAHRVLLGAPMGNRGGDRGGSSHRRLGAGARPLTRAAPLGASQSPSCPCPKVSLSSAKALALPGVGGEGAGRSAIRGGAPLCDPVLWALLSGVHPHLVSSPSRDSRWACRESKAGV